MTETIPAKPSRPGADLWRRFRTHRGAIVGLQFLAGHLEMSLYLLLTAGLYTALRLLGRLRSEGLPRPLLDGDEIGRRLGLAPGAELGAAVKRLREAQVRGEVRTREEAEALLSGGEVRSDCRPGPSGAD